MANMLMDPRKLEIKDFVYDLPGERIAKYPLPERDQSKLLVYRDGKITEDVFSHIDEYITAKSLLMFNNTKVIPARLLFQTLTGARIEIFCLEPSGKYDDVASALAQTGSSKWVCMVGRYGKWKDSSITYRTYDVELTASIIYRLGDAFVVDFKWLPKTLSFASVLEKAGMMPIPPYLKRETEEIDRHRYQTVYAKHEGSVAAPTAGLHFTETVYEMLKAKKVLFDEVTLHVGAGTFKPVKSETLQGHDMHAELVEVRIETIEHIRNSLSKNIIAVGTTSLRTLETLYWMGVKAKLNPKAALQELEIKQWDVYEQSLLTAKIGKAKEMLDALILWLKKDGQEKLICKTQIMIIPPYRLKIVNALITNFHQPGSTLLLLVAAVVGNDWKKIYSYALKKDFRFLSYGDSSLLFAK